MLGPTNVATTSTIRFGGNVTLESTTAATFGEVIVDGGSRLEFEADAIIDVVTVNADANLTALPGRTVTVLTACTNTGGTINGTVVCP